MINLNVFAYGESYGHTHIFDVYDSPETEEKIQKEVNSRKERNVQKSLSLNDLRGLMGGKEERLTLYVPKEEGYSFCIIETDLLLVSLLNKKPNPIKEKLKDSLIVCTRIPEKEEDLMNFLNLKRGSGRYRVRFNLGDISHPVVQSGVCVSTLKHHCELRGMGDTLYILGHLQYNSFMERQKTRKMLYR